MSMHDDPAWEEYLSTGIDPTGGELGPDFDPETGAPLDESPEDDVESPDDVPEDGFDLIEAAIDVKLAELEKIAGNNK